MISQNEIHSYMLAILPFRKFHDNLQTIFSSTFQKEIKRFNDELFVLLSNEFLIPHKHTSCMG